MDTNRTPPPDFPSDMYMRTMTRIKPAFSFRRLRPGGREDIWRGWTDGCDVGAFIARARQISGGGGIEDVRIYIHKELVEFDPPLTAAERNRVRRPR